MFLIPVNGAAKEVDHLEKTIFGLILDLLVQLLVAEKLREAQDSPPNQSPRCPAEFPEVRSMQSSPVARKLLYCCGLLHCRQT